MFLKLTFLYFGLFLTTTFLSILNSIPENRKIEYSVVDVNFSDPKTPTYIPNLKDDGLTPVISTKKITITSTTTEEAILYFNRSTMYDFKIWIVDKNTLIKEYHYGYSVNSLPEEKNQGLSIPISLKNNKNITIYFQMNDLGWPINDQFSVLTIKQRDDKLLFEKRIKIIARSITGIFVVIGLFLGFFLKRKIFFLYVLMNMITYIFIETEYGFILNFLPESFNGMKIQLVDSYIYHSLLFFFYFSLIHNSKGIDIRLYKIMKTFIYIGLLNIPVFIFIDDHYILLNQALLSISGLNTLICYISITYLFMKGIQLKKTMAKPTLLVYIFTASMVIYFSILPNVGLIAKNDASRYIFYIVFTFDLIYYIFVILYKYYQLIQKRKSLLIKYNDLQKGYSLALLEGQELEKNRIGRELHDHIGGNLALIDKMGSYFVSNQQNIIDDTLKSLEAMIKGLKPKHAQEMSCKEQLFQLINRYQGNPFQIDLTLFDQIPKSPYICNQFYRITQELLANALKHSQAKNIYLKYDYDVENNSYNLFYMDNGIGFSKIEDFNGIGIQNMRYRMEKVGGKMKIENTANGCKISFIGIGILETKSFE